VRKNQNEELNRRGRREHGDFMLEKPNLQDEKIIACLRDAYGLQIAEIMFLPLGADAYAGVYRAMTTDGTPYFVKLRSRNFDTISVEVPKFLSDSGISQIIAPIATVSGTLSAQLGEFHVILYPFIEGVNGWKVALSDTQWKIYGQTLKHIHSLKLPRTLADHIPRETYSPYWRERVRQFQAQAEDTVFAEPVAAGLAQFLKEKKRNIGHLIQRAEDLGAVLQNQTTDNVLCHSDIHLGNLLINGETFYIVDWDQPILAPKERDLMFIGGGIGNGQFRPEQEEALFYAGYGQTDIDLVALAYYRYERIVEDFAAYSEEILLTDEGREDRPEGLRRVMSQFQAGAVIDMAYRAEKLLPRELQGIPL
jgi:spectinomycin phosphotransferase